MITSNHTLPLSSLRWKVLHFLLPRISKLDYNFLNWQIFSLFGPLRNQVTLLLSHQSLRAWIVNKVLIVGQPFWLFQCFHVMLRFVYTLGDCLPNDSINPKSHARKKPLLTRYWTVQVTLTSSSSVFLLMRRGGGELPNNDTAPAGSWNATQSQSESISYNIKRGFTVFSRGIKYVVFSFGSMDESIKMKPLGVLSHGTTYLACSSSCWSVDKIILV